MLVVMHTKDLCGKGMKICGLMCHWFVFTTDWTDYQFVGVYCELNEKHSTLGACSRMRKWQWMNIFV